MMIYDKINSDIKKAMIGGNNSVRDALRYLKSKIQQSSIDTRKEVTDEVTISIIKNLMKQNKDSLSYNPSDAKKIEGEIKIWEDYLPQQVEVTDDLISEIVKEVGATSIKEMGKVMGAIKAKYGVNIDMGKASSKVKEVLSKE